MSEPRGFDPVLEKYYGSTGIRPVSVYDGRFFQPGDESVTASRLNTVKPFAEDNNQSGFMRLEDYQDWVELDWKAQHGSWQAVERFGKKLVDEELTQEIAPELFRHIPIRDTSLLTPYQTSTAELVDELGDYLWPMTALASNGCVSLNEAAAQHLHDHDILPKRDVDLKFVDIDYALASGYNPTKSLIDHLFNDDEFEEYNPLIELGVCATGIRNAAEKQYGHNENWLLGGWIEKVGREELQPVIGRAVLVLGYVAQQWARSTLSEVAVKNVRKVSARAATNTIDKIDGPRS